MTLSVHDVTVECERHQRLDRAALTALAPTAADGHRAHLALHLNPEDGTPVLRARRWAGQIATARLVVLAEPLTRATVAALRASWWSRTAVAGAEDVVAVARAAVVQGVWMYDPGRSSGPDYLRTWIVEHVKRHLATVAYAVTVPARVHRRFLRIAAIRARLAVELGRPPEDVEILQCAGEAVTQADLDDERRTRAVRARVVTAEPEAADPRAVAALEVAENAAGEAGWVMAVRSLGLTASEIEIIARHVGLPPYQDLDDRDRSERAVAAHTGVTRSAVRRVLASMRADLGTPGGPFHHLISRMPPGDQEGLGLTRFLHLLDTAPHEPPRTNRPVRDGGREAC
ncbi:hypothetical protein [Actinokineospora spheciospongiae]|uniref:hypothetical protein n=1 Tax=Actinokineospora spheciospongiae TaxID=909613 RepID=UPI000D714851|nr:hypothetical protein [Actinokineospora spheciospongiae]PWW53112.1 hypothetical protein DFQ13_116102 [Actinokineospora spheciospongiae]